MKNRWGVDEMKCEVCGESYNVAETKVRFNHIFDGLDYTREIDGHLCLGCAVEKMNNIIRSQDGYEEPESFY